MGNAGPQQRAPDPSGQRRTSTASSRSQWATPDLNCEVHIPVGNAGPQLRAQIEYQIECQIEGQIEGQKEWQKDMPDRIGR